MERHMFMGATIGTISQSTFVVNKHSERSTIERLAVAAAHSALHDAPARTEETRCHKHTRTKVLNHLERWASGILGKGEDKNGDTNKGPNKDNEDNDEHNGNDDDRDSNNNDKNDAEEITGYHEDLDSDEDDSADEDVSAKKWHQSMEWDRQVYMNRTQDRGTGKDTPIFWLYGGAGAGKSAIMQTLAERFVDQGLVLGSFFFSHSDSTRNTAAVLIPTLVYQLAQVFQSSMDVLGPIVDRDPLVFTKSLQRQVTNLLLPPLQHLVQLGSISDAPHSPRVFLIDGLDECNDPAQQLEIIQAAAAVCHEHSIPVKFLIASRPELEISTSFRSYEEKGFALGATPLSEDPNAAYDICHFIKAKFLKIRLGHPFKNMIPVGWPHISDIYKLVWKSSFHFIYASIAMKYIWSAQEDPTRSLQVILGLEVSRTISPFSQLDALYHHILGSAKHLDKVLQILAHCVYTEVPSQTSVICFMFECSEHDLSIYLADMTPLVTLSGKPTELWMEWQNENSVHLLHASLGDFLRNPSRSRSLYINREVYLASKLERFFQLLNALHQEPRSEYLHKLPPGRNLGIYYPLQCLVAPTIQETGHLVETQEAVKRHGLLDCYKRQLRFMIEDDIHEVIIYLLEFFLAVHSIKTSDGVTLFSSAPDDFLNSLHNYIRDRERKTQYERYSNIYFFLRDLGLDDLTRLEYPCSIDVSQDISGALHANILTLLFMGYPAKAWGYVMIYPWNGTYSTDRWKRIIDAFATADLVSIYQNIANPSKRLTVAAEVILGYLFDDVESRPLFRRPYAGLVHGEMLIQCVAVSNLLDILVWVIPKADISEKIALYSKRTFPQDIYQPCDVARISLLRECFEEYDTRVRNSKMKAFDQRIENGDVDGLIEKSGMLLVNDQD
ncbi:hypothetical protein D9619_004020 [Psilocybe cf. subviscida]|uniref:Nephrocystin 3-like N-terminal domain-containing protein n=1 Tax=Psilocybe cf. subviscida TaxID=2480587 RepID=A0A8H5BR25_9AGAR|nr:hypothetical protein D9619_004020 [Psilocybe cf. subviscida]